LNGKSNKNKSTTIRGVIIIPSWKKKKLRSHVFYIRPVLLVLQFAGAASENSRRTNLL